MVIGVELYCFGVRLENRRFSDWSETGEASSYNEREPVGYAMKTEELRQS
jgi:hypothetical protein